MSTSCIVLLLLFMLCGLDSERHIQYQMPWLHRTNAVTEAHRQQF